MLRHTCTSIRRRSQIRFRVAAPPQCLPDPGRLPVKQISPCSMHTVNALYIRCCALALAIEVRSADGMLRPCRPEGARLDVRVAGSPVDTRRGAARAVLFSRVTVRAHAPSRSEACMLACTHRDSRAAPGALIGTVTSGHSSYSNFKFQRSESAHCGSGPGSRDRDSDCDRDGPDLGQQVASCQ
jgi:hypothetical protein